MTDRGGFDAYLPEDRRRAMVAGRELPGRADGAVLFADVSGFTPLTEALVEELGPRRGAERLTVVLDRVLGALIDEVERFQGAVVYFSGDAITVWVDGDDGRRAVQCGDAMQEAMQRVGRLEVGARAVRLGLKVAIAIGEVRRFVVGDPEVQLIDVLAGAPLDEVAVAEARTEPGQVVVTSSALTGLGDRAEGATDLGGFALLAPLPSDRLARPDPPDPVGLSDEAAASWVLPAVRERLGSGDGAMVAELRRVLPVFIQFGGLDVGAPDNEARVDDFVTGVQRIFADHGGALLQLTVGDKGAYLYGVFGAPVAHEDDPVRAVAAALAVQELAATSGVPDVRTGISRGRVLSGVHGHVRRRTFVCLGDPVNLAARVMGKAAPGEVLVAPEVREAVGTAADWEDRPPVQLKGKALPVALSRVQTLTQERRGTGVDRTPFVGRDRELDLLLQTVHGDRLVVVGVVGPAGAGKSRLVTEAVTEITRRGRPVLRGTARSMGRTTPYQVWREVWRDLLGVTDDATAADEVEAALRAVDEALVPRAPLLAPVLGVELPATSLTRDMDARVRRDSREDLLVRLLAARPGPPPVIVLEDAHAADDVSLSLVAAIRRAARRLRAAIVLVGRPPTGGDADVAGAATTLVELAPLGTDEMALLLDHHVELRFGAADRLHPAARTLVLERAQGNPLTVAELVRALEVQGVDPSSPAAAEADLPASLEALVLARVDRLEDAQRRTLKVASVLLRPFQAETLAEVHPDLGTAAEVEAALERMVGELVERHGLGRYDLRHALTRQVAYDSIPFGLRGRLHMAVGQRVERRHADALAPQYDVLAHHFWHGEEPQPREHYQRLAGAAAKAAYANAAALTYLERLASVTDGVARVDALVDRAEVLLLVGRLEDAVAVQSQAREVARGTGDVGAVARVEAALAESARRGGRFEDALLHLRRAGDGFAEVGDDAGRARVLHLTGTIGAQRGDLDAAGTAYREALAIRDRTGDHAGRASLLSNLGIVAEYDGNLDASATRHAEALAIREELGDPWAVANSQTNLGMVALLQGRAAAARTWFEQALAGNERVGDPWHVALGHHNLGNALRDLGELDTALEEYRAASERFLAAGDEWALALLLEDGASLAAAAGHGGAAVELIGTTDRLREELASPRAQQLEAMVAAILRGVAEIEAREARLSRGRDRSAESAVLLLLGLPAPLSPEQ